MLNEQWMPQNELGVACVKNTLSFEELLELWNAQLEAKTEERLANLLTHGNTAVLDEVFEWLICYCHLFSPESISRFSESLLIKISLDLDLDADADAGRELWYRALSRLNDEHRKLLRLVPDDEVLGNSTQPPEAGLKQTVEAAKDDLELYEALFAATAERLAAYPDAVSEFRHALIAEILDEDLKEDLDD